MRIGQKSSRKYIVVAIIILAILLAGVWIYVSLFSSNGQQSKSSDSPVPQQYYPPLDDVNSPEKDSQAEQNQQSSREPEKNITPAYEGDSSGDPKTITGSINHKSVTGGNLVIRSTINQSLSTGKCDLTLTSGQKIVTKSSSIIQNPSSSSCEGFDIPISELGTGKWSIKIIFSSGDATGSMSSEVTI